MGSVKLSVILTVCLAGVAIGQAATDESGYTEISRSELKRAIEDKTVTLLDCNGTEAYDKGHIPGAINYYANMNTLADVLPSDKGALIVSYCSGGNCPKYKVGVSMALRLGYTNVKYYGDGLHGWKSAGEKVARNK